MHQARMNWVTKRCNIRTLKEVAKKYAPNTNLEDYVHLDIKAEALAVDFLCSFYLMIDSSDGKRIPADTFR